MLKDVSDSRLAERSLQATGNDLVLEPLGDLVTTEHGDLDVKFGSESIQDSLLRRLQTPGNGYARWVKTPQGLKLYGEGYGDQIYNYLSSPLSRFSIEQMRLTIDASARADSRIVVQRVEIQNINQTTVKAIVFYFVKGEEQLISLTTTLSPEVVIQNV